MRDQLADGLKLACGLGPDLGVLEPTANRLLNRLQGEQGIPAREAVAVRSLVVGIVQVESQRGSHDRRLSRASIGSTLVFSSFPKVEMPLPPSHRRQGVVHLRYAWGLPAVNQIDAVGRGVG